MGGMLVSRTAGAEQLTALPFTEKVRVPLGRNCPPEVGVTVEVRVTGCPDTGAAGEEVTWVLVAKDTTCQV